MWDRRSLACLRSRYGFILWPWKLGRSRESHFPSLFPACMRCTSRLCQVEQSLRLWAVFPSSLSFSCFSSFLYTDNKTEWAEVATPGDIYPSVFNLLLFGPGRVSNLSLSSLSYFGLKISLATACWKSFSLPSCLEQVSPVSKVLLRIVIWKSFGWTLMLLNLA